VDTHTHTLILIMTAVPLNLKHIVNVIMSKIFIIDDSETWYYYYLSVFSQVINQWAGRDRLDCVVPQ
jgi:hypothetical protein